jgi:hypothetical protein
MCITISDILIAVQTKKKDNRKKDILSFIPKYCYPDESSNFPYLSSVLLIILLHAVPKFFFITVHRSQYSSCARDVDMSCIKQFITKMKADQNLCVNIIFKYECLRAKTKTCKASIIKDLLDVFPDEANKVLSVLCSKAQDSG